MRPPAGAPTASGPPPARLAPWPLASRMRERLGASLDQLQEFLRPEQLLQSGDMAPVGGSSLRYVQIVSLLDRR